MTAHAPLPKHPSAVEMYLADIRRYELLTAEEERLLADRSKAGDASARAELVVRNLRFVVKRAFRLVRINPGLEEALPDLIQEGSLGLMHAAEKFEPERGLRLLSYATFWIDQSIGRFIDSNSTIRVPLHMVGKIRAALRRGEEALAIPVAVSFDDASREGKVGWLDLFPATSEDIAEKLDRRAEVRTVREWLSELPERESDILLARYDTAPGKIVSGYSAPLRKRYGISRQRISQIAIAAEERIREIASRPPLEELVDVA